MYNNIGDNNYCVYIHISPSGKKYIGITSDYDKRCKEHINDAKSGRGFAFHEAIRKYGWDNFLHRIVESDVSRERACELEMFLIEELNTFGADGYNLTVGGEGTDSISQRYRRVKNRKKSVKGYRKSGDKWRVSIGYMGKHLSFDSYTTEEEARNRAQYLFSISDEELIIEHEKYKNSRRDRIKGYYWDNNEKKWIVVFKINERQEVFGRYTKENDAVIRANFIKNITDTERAKELQEYKINNIRESRNYFFDDKKQKYRVYKYVSSKNLYFGYYDTEDEAKRIAETLIKLDDNKVTFEHKRLKDLRKQNVKGYFFDKKRKKYRVKIRIEGKEKCFGSYETEQDAKNRVIEVLRSV